MKTPAYYSGRFHNADMSLIYLHHFACSGNFSVLVINRLSGNPNNIPNVNIAGVSFPRFFHQVDIGLRIYSVFGALQEEQRRPNHKG
jgi:hypothetical protein